MNYRQSDLKCPVCSSPNYTKVKIELPDGEIYGADVYRCTLCAFRFINPGRTAPTFQASYKAASR